MFLKAAELLAGPWRATMNAATMLGQSKTAHQAEIDSACELIDFWRFNVALRARSSTREQPISRRGIWNQLDYRPLEGFVLRADAVQLHRDRRQPADRAGADGQHGAVEAGRAPACSSAWYIFQLLEEAGLPPGVINFVPGCRAEIDAACARRTPTSPASTSPARPTCSAACGRRVGEQPRALHELPAHRRRDRRQGLHPRAPVGRSRRRSPPRSCAAASSTRARSARRRRASTSRESLWREVTDALVAHDRGDQDGRRRATSRTSWAR